MAEMSSYAFVDVEVGLNDHKIHDIGAVRSDGAVYHGHSRQELRDFLGGVTYLCGHNIVHHDVKYLFGDEACPWTLVDTLYMSPILFAERPYHRLVKDYKLDSEQSNNPVSDCELSRTLLMDEIAQWDSLSAARRAIFASLLCGVAEFEGFMKMVGAQPVASGLSGLISDMYLGRICANAKIDDLVRNSPCELAYALAIIDTSGASSVTPGWVLSTYPSVEAVLGVLCHTPCMSGCDYCRKHLDVHSGLKRFFGFDSFRTYEGEPLQERAARAAVEGKSLLAIFPTGGGKSLTFQLPALMSGRCVHGLTVVISPLQSLMKDQVDNLVKAGITDAVYINGLQDPLERSVAIERAMGGEASLLYIAPESLRSKTILRILSHRNVVRFVIDEAHCFSSWGQDFRVDYLYIGRFIREFQKSKGDVRSIPISCFTATAKQKVIQDICDYFKRELGVDLHLFASSASRTNLRYRVIHVESDEDKYAKLRGLISSTESPTIVYVSRTKRTADIAQRLRNDGYAALPFHGQMSPDEKSENQDAFMSGKTRIIVATSAFGMGVDKKDVGLVIHYDISDSLENYVQEAGRAGRDPSMTAQCFVLYGDGDLDAHFLLLNQTKLSISEIQQVWKAVKELTRTRKTVSSSALEIARRAGWNDSVKGVETRVRTALSALEQAGYLERGNNVPHVYATGIVVKNMDEARERLTKSSLFDEADREKAIRVIKSLISEKHIAKAQDGLAESRVDYLADILGLRKEEVVSVVLRMRQESILADSKDITAYLPEGDTAEAKVRRRLERFASLERHVVERIASDGTDATSKTLNESAIENGMKTSTEKDIRTLLSFLTVHSYVNRQYEESADSSYVMRMPPDDVLRRIERRIEVCRYAIGWLYRQPVDVAKDHLRKFPFSVVELWNDVRREGGGLFYLMKDLQLKDVEEALLFLAKVDVLKLEGGFVVLYNAMTISRVKDNKFRYKQEDYRILDEFYRQKVQQVHIVGEYANMMVKDYEAALRYVSDYFQMDYKLFIGKYFSGGRRQEIDRMLTSAKYRRLFGALSDRQMEIISDKESRCIVVAAGPGSGKTRVLVHKLASILHQEDVKSEQLLMLTFSRAAAVEFKTRLLELVGAAAYYVDIKTFHSYCFDLLGRVGSLEDADNVVATAAYMIRKGNVEPVKISKSVLVIDEAQDMSQDEYELVTALMEANEDMRVVAVGDDDQNIYSFRGSSSRFMGLLLEKAQGHFVEMTENYRSSRHVVAFANAFVRRIGDRMKQTPIVAMSSEDGYVELMRHVSHNLFEPVVENVLAHRRLGSCCILTRTNQEAATVVALLRLRGVSCKLVQSLDKFSFANLAEVRYLSKRLSQGGDKPVYDDEVWEAAKSDTMTKYATSKCLPYLMRCITQFETVNRIKYRSDFQELVRESFVEDFCDVSGAQVVVSTIHKSKGREFDDVYMLIEGEGMSGDDFARCCYVGMTRAKRRLFVHTVGDYFDGLPADKVVTDSAQYPMPSHVALQLTHVDVFLSFFSSLKRQVLSLRSGDRLGYRDGSLYLLQTPMEIGRLSKKMREELSEWENRGYEVVSANVRFVVAWRPKTKVGVPADEIAVLLPDLMLERKAEE